MNDHKAFLLSSAILAALIIALLSFVFIRKSETGPGDPVPQFSRAEFSDNTLKGQVTLVNFFASWCPPCEAEHPFLLDLKTNYGITIYGVNYKDSDIGRRDYLQRMGNPYVAVTSDQDGSFAELWGVKSVPETILVNTDGMIIMRIPKPLTPDYIQKELLPAIRSLRK